MDPRRDFKTGSRDALKADTISVSVTGRIEIHAKNTLQCVTNKITTTRFST